MGVILVNKVLWKLNFSKNVNNKKWAPKIIFFNEKMFYKVWIIFDIENWLWKSEISTFGHLSFGKRYEVNLRVIFYQWPKLGLGLDVEAEIQILEVI
jgi:hypothetical protein